MKMTPVMSLTPVKQKTGPESTTRSGRSVPHQWDHIYSLPCNRGRCWHTRSQMSLSRSSSVALVLVKMSFSIGVCCQQMQMKMTPRPYWKWWLNTICGFAFASSWIEQASKRTLQRSIGMYRTLVLPLTDLVVLACTVICINIMQ